VQGARRVGIDLGGTKIAGVLLNEDAVVLARRREESDAARGPAAIVATIARMVGELAGEAGGWSVGVGVAGQVDPASGVVAHAPNLGWIDYPLRERLSERLGRAVHVLNDVQAATFAEWRLGAGRGEQDIVCVFAGTGVGGGCVVDGRLQRGAGGSAGELGHIPVSLHGPACRCGARGCVEAYAGGWALARRAVETMRARPEQTAGIRAQLGDDGEVTASHLVMAAAAGDEVAADLLQEAGTALGACAVAIVNAFNPAMLILGGGVMEAVPALAVAVQRAVRLSALQSAAQRVRIVPAALGGDAGAVGAALWAGEHAAPP
jgi:glucokinase